MRAGNAMRLDGVRTAGRNSNLYDDEREREQAVLFHTRARVSCVQEDGAL